MVDDKMLESTLRVLILLMVLVKEGEFCERYYCFHEMSLTEFPDMCKDTKVGQSTRIDLSKRQNGSSP
jgi:hypothetical protein